MSGERPLRGMCLCGRNRYIVELPPDHEQQAYVFFDNSAASRRHQATPITAWLRVPLSCYRSATFALFPDETHADIRRTYTTASASQERRQFCGFCGTQLSSWNESSRDAAEFISLTLGSLLDDDLEELESWGLLPSADSEDEEPGTTQQMVASNGSGTLASPSAGGQSVEASTSSSQVRGKGVPWFESMVEDSTLGRIRRRKGGHTSRDGATTVEWEVIETDDGETVASSTTQQTVHLPGKRKHEGTPEPTSDDVDMS